MTSRLEHVTHGAKSVGSGAGARVGFRGRLHGALAAALLVSALGAGAAEADAPPAAASADASPRGAELVKPGLYRIGGADGGSLLRVGRNGMVVVDTQRAGAYRSLMAEIRRIAGNADLPVRALILTGAGPEQAGNVAQFVEAGVPVIVQRGALAGLAGNLLATGVRVTPKSFIAYDDDYRLIAGDLEVEIEHVGRGRSGADSIAYFRDLRVVAVGELFTAGTPGPDCAAGGSLAGWAIAIDHLMWSDFDLAVPSRGPAVGKPELVAFKARLAPLAARAGTSASGPADCRPARK